MIEIKNYINGKLSKPLDKKYLDVFNPSNGEIYGEILTLLKAQGKKSQVQSIMNGVPIVDIVTPTNYYLSTLDFFLLADYYKIPLIILCRTKIPTLFSHYSHQVHCIMTKIL